MLAFHNCGKSESLPNYLRQKISKFLGSGPQSFIKGKNQEKVDDASVMASVLLLTETDDYEQIMGIIDKLTLQDGEILQVIIQIIQRRFRYLSENRLYFDKLAQEQDAAYEVRKQAILKNVDPGLKEAVEQTISLY